MVYTVSQYLKRLTQAKRAEKTIKLYGEHFRYFSDFLGVPVSELHKHLTKENLIEYAEHIQDKATKSRQLALSILLRYYKVNGITAFDELEIAVLKPRDYEEPDDKPLTLDILKKIMEVANIRERAMVTMLISTGMRAGELSAITTDDVDGDTVRIRPEVTHQRGRTVYLHAEARKALDVWLSHREEYKISIDRKYYSRGRTGEDTRLFCCSYTSLKNIWLKLYNRVDGERGKYHAKCTTHSCRKYFRTNAVHKMDLDLVEKIMGHEGYLTKAYVRITDEDARRMFHEGEHTLYITRPDQRIQDGELAQLREKVAEMKNLEMTVASNQVALQELEKRMSQLTGAGTVPLK